MPNAIVVSFALSLMTVASCQQTAKRWILSEPEQLLITQAHFAGALYPIETAEQIFALPAHTKTELTTLLTSHQDINERSIAIVEYILSHTGKTFLYNLATTKTASDTLTTRQANCLSLSILTYSIAREIGLNATFQNVSIPEFWSSQLNQTWLNGHINVRLQQPQHDAASDLIIPDGEIIIDFDPDVTKQQFATEAISSQRVVAMFYNNKAAEAFDNFNYALTYRYYRAAIAADPDYAVTWSNLAVLYRQHHFIELAEQTYHHSLALDPTAANTMANLAVLYRLTGNNNDAEKLEQLVYEKRKMNPWYYLMLGTEALNRNLPDHAIDLFKQALALDAQMHQAFSGLASSYLALNDNLSAIYYLTLSKQAAISMTDKKRYDGKIRALNHFAGSG
ncbi:hypothetical protein [Arsukibacterium sp.]|uniref:tetratricopeptide repeat protein n=1 Tax=Arsukibacterium sp. TaxID=1977258 RepID=UPI00299CEEE6|nr:hypothetical protein [Arsukibacterium sp.]MDX1676661.1 hypothetical protein [Arsukibacterium sp.]